MDFLTVCDYFVALQKTITVALETADNAPARPKNWQSQLGQGTMMQFSDGEVFERGGVNFSRIAAQQLPPAASHRYPELAGVPYQAAGVSLVLHPHNPYCPTVHMNVRFFCTDKKWWFGGGLDLTPYYGFTEDCVHFHQTIKTALDKHDPALYPLYKKQCDGYFYLKHRAEPRGIGGIFFDDRCANSLAEELALVQSVGNSFSEAYLPIISKRHPTPYSARQIAWQRHRRGRYVEFNLVYDRGTLFGLQSGGNADNILMSLPPQVSWGQALTLTAEEESLGRDFLCSKEWV